MKYDKKRGRIIQSLEYIKFEDEVTKHYRIQYLIKLLSKLNHLLKSSNNLFVAAHLDLYFKFQGSPSTHHFLASSIHPPSPGSFSK